MDDPGDRETSKTNHALFRSEYQIHNVAEVNVESWTVSILGAVAKPLTISSRNLTNFQQETVQAAFVPGDGERTSNWTGISMLDVLNAANMSYRAEKITIVAIDGYVKNYTLQEVEDSNMLIGFEENGDHLGQSQRWTVQAVLSGGEVQVGAVLG